MKTPLYFYICLLLRLGQVVSGAVEYSTATKYQLTPDGKLLLSLRVLTDGETDDTGAVKVNQQTENVANYRVFDTNKNGEKTEVPLLKVRALNSPYTSTFILYFPSQTQIKTDAIYQVDILNNAWRMKDGSVFAGSSSDPTKPDEGAFIKEVIADRYFEKEFKVETGTSGGTVSLKLNYVTGRPTSRTENTGSWKFAVAGKAEVTLPKDKRFEFANSITTESSFFYRTPWPTGQAGTIRYFGDFGGQTEVNSDQVFDNVEIAGASSVESLSVIR